MANVVIALLEGSVFSGSPIVYRVTPTAIAGNVVFHRIRLTVTVNMEGGADMVFPFAKPVDGNHSVDFDISSALCAVAETWNPSATWLPANALRTYPNITYRIDAVEDYMIGGQSYEGRNGASTNNQTVYMGALTDYERLTGIRPTRYSRKPTTTKEIVHRGRTILVPGLTSSAPSVQPYIVGEDDISDLNVYPIDTPRDSYEIRFINSFGVHESVHVTALKTSDVPITTEEYIIARQETLTQFSRGIAIKKNNQERWKMSSGPLDEAWASWYIHEFLMVQWAWIKVGDVYIPCHIMPDDTTQLIDRTKDGIITVPFTVKLDITGSPA